MQRTINFCLIIPQVTKIWPTKIKKQVALDLFNFNFTHASVKSGQEKLHWRENTEWCRFEPSIVAVKRKEAHC